MPEYEISDTGDYEITGEDLSGEETGLAAPRRGTAAPPGVQREPPPRRRLGQTMPMGSFLIAGFATQVFTAQPQRPIRLQRLFLSSPTLASFVVSNLVIGADQQFTNTGDAPAEMFGPTAVGANLKASTANPGILVTVTVRNITGVAATMTAAVIGDALE